MICAKLGRVGDPDGHVALRQLPAVGALLASPEVATLIERFGRALVVDAARTAVETTRHHILETGEAATVTPTDIARTVENLRRRSLRRVINGTGVLLHTNLGRAPLPHAAQEALLDASRGYCSVELDLATGERGDRHRHAGELCARLLAAEAALAFNNNAGAVLVMLAAVCRGKEVLVARGELVEIGGGFRVPDVMRESGCTLVEVGTTNKVYEHDYASAMTERTGAILRVHRSNFALVGFVAEPGVSELAALARSRGVPLMVDVGSGLVADEGDLGPSAALVRAEPRPQAVLAEGADLIAFSGDKLFGGPQAGILAGRVALLERVRRHPLARALRADKLTLAALEATLRLYLAGQATQIPVIRLLSITPAEIAARADRIRAEIEGASRLSVEVREGESVAGGGSLPLARLPTRLVLIGPGGEAARALALALRGSEPPLITRMVEDRVAIDVRTLDETEIPLIAPLVERAHARTKLDDKEATP